MELQFHCNIPNLYFLFSKSIGSVTIEKAQDESVRRSGFSTVGAAANIDFPGMFPDIVEEESS